MSDLPTAIAELCQELGSVHLRSVTQAAATFDCYSPLAVSGLSEALPGPKRSSAQPLLDAWSAQPQLSGDAISLAIQSVTASELVADDPRVEVVCTGPDSPVAPVRLTSEVVCQLIDNAATRVMLVSYAAYGVKAVMAAIEAAAARGVRVELVLELGEKLDGGGGAAAYNQFTTYVWPLNQRPPHASLHAKAVIVDGRAVLLTSANLTNAAYDLNLELGVLVRGGGVARSVQQHFDALIATGQLVRQ